MAVAVGYDVDFEIPYHAVRREAASDPEHMKKLLSRLAE